jgi:hypothetical protein
MRIVLVAAVLVIVGIASVPVLWPAMAAYACPSCYGLLRVTGSLFVDPAMSVEGYDKAARGRLARSDPGGLLLWLV